MTHAMAGRSLRQTLTLALLTAALLLPGAFAKAGEAVFLRLVEGTPVPGYKPLTTTGWNAIEMLVQDPDAVARRLAGTAFTRLGAPAFLAPGSSIRATQFTGPAGEVFYFTADTGPAADSTLARAGSPVDRPFILVLAGEDVDTLAAFYRERFALPQAFRSRLPIPVIARAQGRSENEDFPLALLRLAAFSHSLELDGYGKVPGRPTVEGELPPGVALASFLVADLDALGDLPYLAPPSVQWSAPYDGRRSATLRGPAGELIELVEAPVVGGVARPD
jgi:hypothetical protein